MHFWIKPAGALFALCLGTAASAQDSAWKECGPQPGNWDQKIAACTQVIARGERETDDRRSTAYNNRGWARSEKRDFYGAILDLDQAIRLNPKNAMAYSNRGGAYAERREHQLALKDLTEAIRLDPQHPYAYGSRGWVYNLMRDFERAVPDLTRALALNPKNANAYVNRGWAYVERREFERAVQDLSKGIALNPSNAWSYVLRGEAHKAKGDAERALADFEAALKIEPANRRADVGREVARSILQIRARAEGAEREKAAELRSTAEPAPSAPVPAPADPTRSLCLEGAGGSAERVADCTRLLSARVGLGLRDRVAALVARSRAHLSQGAYAAAVADADEALRLDPGGAPARRARGAALQEQGQTDRAVADFGEAIRLNPADPGAYLERAGAHQRRGNWTAALADFRAAAALDPRSEEAASGERRIRAIVGAPEVKEATPAGASKPPSITLSAPPPVGETRVALVVGNSHYTGVNVLPNAARDAEAVARALREAGFKTVQVEGNLGREGMIRALRRFEQEAESADWSVIYYAGHGIEVGGQNYLIPTDARLLSDRDVQDEAIPLERVLGTVEGTRKLRLVILDACRDNPFEAQMKRKAASRSVGRGLARIEPEGATLVAYAAKHGQVALDGEGSNSPFVSALVRRLATPGLEIRKLFGLVRDDVLAATGRRQEPYIYGTLGGDDYILRVR